MDAVSRRGFLGIVSAVAVVPADVIGNAAAEPRYAATLHEGFPRQDPELAKEIVSVSHGNVARVKELVSSSPALARASWDWGYGDWETALGAASHVGNKEIAAVLLGAGAHPTIFSAAMLGQLDIVVGYITASPGIQRTRGPHGITLLDHAKAGESVEVVKYLESLGDASPRYPSEPVSEDEGADLLGSYAFGPDPTERLIVSKNSRGSLVVKREGEPERNLFHHGRRVFNPAGAEAVRIRFTPESGRATTLIVVDGPLRVEAGR